MSILYPSIHFTHTNTNTNTNGVVTLSQRLRTRAVQMKHPSSISITSYLDQFVGFVGLVPTCSVSVSTSNVCVFCTGGQCNTSTVVLTEMLALFIWEGVGVTKFRKATVSPTVNPKRYTGPVNIQPDAQFFVCMFYFYSVHVSGSHVPIIRRIVVSMPHLVYVTLKTLSELFKITKRYASNERCYF